MRTRKSFHEIIKEEEREKKEREEYGESVWFVTRKPRSTSFEGIVEQQRREERVAEEEREREVEDEVLRLVLEMSKHDAQPGQSSSLRSGGKGWREPSARPSPSGVQAARRGARRSNESARPQGTTKGLKTPRQPGAPRAQDGTEQGRRCSNKKPSRGPSGDGRNRRSKRLQGNPQCCIPAEQVASHARKEERVNTLVP